MAAQASVLRGFRTRATPAPLSLAPSRQRLAGQGPFSARVATSSGTVSRLGRRGGHPPPKHQLSRPSWGGSQWPLSVNLVAVVTRNTAADEGLRDGYHTHWACRQKARLFILAGRDGSDPECKAPTGPLLVLGG